MNARLPKHPTHPGEMLLKEFLKPLGMTQVAFARHVGVSFKRINELVNGRRAVTPETAFLLAGALGTTPQFWMNLQTTYDLVHHPARHKVKPLRIAV